MNSPVDTVISETSYKREECAIGVVHLGFGAFHRAHQAVYFDDFMEVTGDLRWGIATVNLRAADAPHFTDTKADIHRHEGYYLKSYSADGDVDVRCVRSHIHFSDWSSDKDTAEALLSRPTVHVVTITVTESGYYTDTNGDITLTSDIIASELNGPHKESVYSYLRSGLQKRMAAQGAPLTIACCDNIRQNGKMLRRNLLTYLDACGDTDLHEWVSDNVAFPCSMVDRITPRSPSELGRELSEIVGRTVSSPVMAEDYIQWVLQDNLAGEFPDLSQVGVTITADIDPYEETKIRVLNGGHTALAYMAALGGIETFDAAMRVPELKTHFCAFETEEVLPAITVELPFSKESYLELIQQRFGNRAIGDTVARISADGMAKFPIFILPTIEGCLRQGITPYRAIQSIASWHQFARHCQANKIPFDYNEPSWHALEAMLGTDDFLTSRQLWGDIPETYPIFAEVLKGEISEMELKWPV